MSIHIVDLDDQLTDWLTKHFAQLVPHRRTSPETGIAGTLQAARGLRVLRSLGRQWIGSVAFALFPGSLERLHFVGPNTKDGGIGVLGRSGEAVFVF